jgi:hypothetical protein
MADISCPAWHLSPGEGLPSAQVFHVTYRLPWVLTIQNPMTKCLDSCLYFLSIWLIRQEDT